MPWHILLYQTLSHNTATHVPTLSQTAACHSPWPRVSKGHVSTIVIFLARRVLRFFHGCRGAVKQEIRDGVRYEIPAPDGTIPPRAVKLPALSEDGTPGQGEGASIKVRLGQTTSPIKFTRPKTGRLGILSDKGAKWLDIPLQQCGASLALIWRGGKDWSEPRAIVVPDDAAARAEGTVSFANLTAAPMAIVIGTEKIRLNPGKTFERKITPGGAALPLEISYPLQSGELRNCLSSSLEFNRGSFHRLIIYAADGSDPRMPVKVLQLQEPS